MLYAFITGIVFGFALGMWLSHRFMNSYVASMVPTVETKTVVILPDKKHSGEVPALLEAIDKIHVNQGMN